MAQGSNDFEALARQYWGMWGDAMRGSAVQAVPDIGLQGFRDALDAWTGAASRDNGFQTVLDHFSRQSGDWQGLMQQVAARFAGREHSAAEVAGAWRDALAASGLDGFQGLFQGMRGPGLQDIGQWSEAAAPWLRQWQGEASSWLSMPAFGFTREHQERVQALAQAQLDWQQALQAYNTLMAKASQDAYGRFEVKLGQHDEPGKQVASTRALFDLWIDAAEEAYADVALSPDYRKAYGALVNAQMRLRSVAQAIAEQQAASMGLPGRTELDSAHRKLAELERQLRRLQRAVDAVPAQVSREAAPPAKARQTRSSPARRAPARAAASAGAGVAKPAKRARPATSAQPAKSKAAARPAAAAKVPVNDSASTTAGFKTGAAPKAKPATRAVTRKPAARRG